MLNFREEKLRFQDSGSKKVSGSFDGGEITSDAGGLLLKEIEASRQILMKFSECFKDYRRWYTYSVEQLLSQRIYALALGYEDLNDHEELRNDPTLRTLVGNNLAGKSTLNRLELTPADADRQNRYKKIVFNEKAIEDFFVNVFIESFEVPPYQITLDLDSTDDEIHGNQEGRHYHGYYGHYCYLPLYIFSGNFLLCAKLRPSNIDGAKGALDELKRIVKKIREAWPEVEIVVRGDAGFCRDDILNWCEEQGFEFNVGLAKNDRLLQLIEKEMAMAKAEYEATQKPVRIFTHFRYRTIDSWSRERTVIAKVEHLEKGANPRFIISSLEPLDNGKQLYEDLYCQRGEMENRIKEQKLDLFSGRTSCATFRANQLRLWFSAVAYLLINELRRIALKGTELAKAQCSTIRNKLFKLGASVYTGARTIRFRFAEGYPFQKLFRKILNNIQKKLT